MNVYNYLFHMIQYWQNGFYITDLAEWLETIYYGTKIRKIMY